ncbi:hypothetical protein PDPJ_7_00004 [Photobacterium damselae subsp. piscicida]|nr:hypothetical protein PDPJ_7_00004 [Photobacterium damselae subsp. piscicida]
MYVHKRINYSVHIIYEIQIGNNDFVFQYYGRENIFIKQ